MNRTAPALRAFAGGVITSAGLMLLLRGDGVVAWLEAATMFVIGAVWFIEGVLAMVRGRR